MQRSRGQSETVGVILLTAVIVVLAVLVGAFVLADFESQTDDDPLVDVESTVTAERIELEHRGGDSFESGQITVILQGETDQRYTLSTDFALATAGSNRTFVAGDKWRRPNDGISGEIQLLVVDESSNELLHDATHVVEPRGIFEVSDVSASYNRTTETASVSYSVENTGAFEDTQEIVASSRTDERRRSTTLAPGESTTGNFTLDIREAGSQQITVASANDRASSSIAPAPATFDITAFDVTFSDGTATATYTISNTGDFEDTQQINFTAGDATATEQVTLGPDESTSGSFSESISGVDDELVAELRTDDDTASDIIVVDGPDFSLSLDSVESSVEAGETITANYTLENTGDVGGTTTVSLNVGSGSDTVTLASGESTTGSISYTTDEGDVPSLSITLEESETGDTSATETVEVLTDPELDSWDVTDNSDSSWFIIYFYVASFDVSYSVDDPAGELEEVVATFENEDGNTETLTDSSGSASGTLSYEDNWAGGYTASDDFTITIEVYRDGEVVDSETISTQADY